MDRPHCNNSNNVHVHGTGAQLYNHSPQMPDKSRCNGITENGCFSFDPGYSSFQPEKSEQTHSMCNPKSEQNIGQFQMPGSTPNGTVFMEHHQHVDPMQTPLQNGPIYPQQPLRYSGHSGLKRFPCSGEAVHGYQIPESIPNGPPLTPSLQNGYQSVQNGHINQKSPERCSRQGGPRHFSDSGETVDEYQRTERIPNGPPLTPNSQNGYQSRMQNGPTSPRPPPVLIRKHSSFLRQNAIEEEDDDNTDELNDSGFGSMCRTTSWEQPRRSRSKDVSDAAADDDTTKLVPRRLQRSQSSQEKTDNELAQYTEKRRCSSEQILQRSDRSSGYFSVDSIQGEIPTGDGSKPDDLAGAEAKASAEDNDDMILNIRGLKDTLNACKTDRWEVVELHEEISSDPAVQQLLASEVHCQLMKKLSMEAFLHDSQIGQPITSDMACHSTQANGHLNGTVQGLRSTTSRPEVEEGLSKYIPDNSRDLQISLLVHDQRGSDDTTSAQKQVPEIKVPHHGDTMDKATKDKLQKLLERRAYCEAMEHHRNCIDLECFETGVHHQNFKQCWSEGSRDKCSGCRETVKAYWNHSLGCHSDRCMLPFCCYFKELRSEKRILHPTEMQDFEGAFGCLVRQTEIEVLEKLHELQQLQHPTSDGEEAWNSDNNAEISLRKGQPDCPLTTEGRLCKFGRFTPIRCKATKLTKDKNTVVIKKIQYCQNLTRTLQLLHDKTQSIEEDDISTCLPVWYRQINKDKLLVCSTYLSEKSLFSCLDLLQNIREQYWKEACNAAIKLHEFGILYLNWKVDHVRVTPEGRVKLCNLDYAVDISCSTRELKGSLSEEWRGKDVPEHVKTGLDPRIAPPEVLVDGGGLSKESDSWGLGCLLYQLYNDGRLPYSDLSHCSDDEIRDKRLSEDHSTLVPASHKIQLLTDMCWKEDKMKRRLPGELTECLDKYNELETH